MKRVLNIVLALGFLFLLSCEESENSPLSSDNVSPEMISNVEYSALPGGVLISYKKPDDKDLMSVKAVYTNPKGKKMVVVSSVYSSTIEVLGFADTVAQTIELYAVDRSLNESKPYVLKANPGIAPINSTKLTLKMDEDFGGIKITGVNASNANLAFLVFGEDSVNNFKNVETYYTSQDSVSFSVRGFKPKLTKFGIVVRDQYDNYSDTVYANLTPWLEEQITPETFKLLVLNNDEDFGNNGRPFMNLFDNDMTTNCHTSGLNPRPAILTFDLGKKAVISRIKLYHRPEWLFNHGNPKTYSIYGMLETPDQSGDLKDWIKLGDFEAKRPTEHGGSAEDDVAAQKNGFEHTMPKSVEIRYFRLVVKDVWGGDSYTTFSQLRLWGQVIN